MQTDRIDTSFFEVGKNILRLFENLRWIALKDGGRPERNFVRFYNCDYNLVKFKMYYCSKINSSKSDLTALSIKSN